MWALGATACAVSTEDPDSDEQVGETSEEIRNYHLPGSPFGNSAQQGDMTCVQRCALIRANCEAWNDAVEEGEPMEPCGLQYATCIWNCPLPR
jgi:hypothetical protein